MLQHKILGLDVGSRTVGIAISDIMGWTAQGLEQHSESMKKIMN